MSTTRQPGTSWTTRAWWWLAMLVQWCGGGIIIWQGVPIYRKFIYGEPAGDANPAVYGWAALAALLVHPAYWLTQARPVPLEGTPRVLLGHVVLFAGRAAFIFAGGIFAAVFYARFGQLGLRPSGYAVVLAVLFTMFCVSRATERLGTALAQSEAPATPPTDRNPADASGKG